MVGSDATIDAEVLLAEATSHSVLGHMLSCLSTHGLACVVFSLVVHILGGLEFEFCMAAGTLNYLETSYLTLLVELHLTDG